jgi:hypothetical protein
MSAPFTPEQEAHLIELIRRHAPAPSTTHQERLAELQIEELNWERLKRERGDADLFVRSSMPRSEG